jgi:hypothetical protein
VVFQRRNDILACGLSKKERRIAAAPVYFLALHGELRTEDGRQRIVSHGQTAEGNFIARIGCSWTQK